MTVSTPTLLMEQNDMGYTVWDRKKGAPAINRRYVTHFAAAKACERLNAKAFATKLEAGDVLENDRYFIKEL